MPEISLGVIIFCSVFALAFSGAVMWLMERKARASRRQIAPFSYSFLAGCFTFSAVYILNRLIFPGWPKATAAVNFGILAGLFAFRAARKQLLRQYRRLRPKISQKHPRRFEAAALEQMLERDPLNAFCLEKLSEIYEEMGESGKALEAAQKAVKLDPTLKNKWRVEDLENAGHEKKRHNTGWNFLKK